MTVLIIKKELKKEADSKKAAVLQKFFKTNLGEYGEGDIFLGVAVPKIREIAKKHKTVKLTEVVELLRSKIHEERMTALFIMADKFQLGNEKEKESIFKTYFKNTKYINNWDLVDLSVDKIIGSYLFNRPKNILYKLAKSKNIWERRMAIIATFNFIKKNKISETLKIAQILLEDKHDLIHKAVGWMLREVGKKDIKAEEDFINKHYKRMSRITIRYAIEKFSEKKRKHYLMLGK